MEFEPISIPGAFLIRPKAFDDERGSFVKVLHLPTFESHGIDFRTAESFYSTSKRGAIRGMHFQVPPAAHQKLVYCTAGRVLDVLVDLRKGSPATGHSYTAELSADNRQMLYVPMGVAHGFLTLEDDSTLVYSVTTAHAPAYDRGIRWDSFGFDWPVANPLISERDRSFPALGAFESPFVFQP